MKPDAILEFGDRDIGRFTTVLNGIGPGRAGGEYRFTLHLRDEDSTLQPAVISGLYFEGYGRYYRPWLEVRYETSLTGSGGETDLSGSQEEEKIFMMLCSILPPGSHIMVPYRTHRITAMALIFGVPPAASPLGHLMYIGGCRWYKDWYFAEGFLEGEEKLQATKPLDEVKRREKTREIKKEIREYLARNADPAKPEMESICRELGRRILEMEES